MSEAARDGVAHWAKNYLLPIAVLIALVAMWQAACDYAKIPVWLLPSPVRIWTATAEIAHTLPKHVLATLSSVVGGFILSLVVGVPLAVAIVYSPLFRRVVYPMLVVFQSVPKVALAPLLLLWVGYGVKSNILVAAIVAFFPIVINTATGLEAVEPELLQLTRSLDAGSLKTFWKVRLPWALPYLFSAMKVAVTLAVIGAVVGEFVGADRGLGYLILTSSSSMNTALVFGVLVMLSLIGITLFYLVVGIERLLCPWYLPSANDALA